MHTIKHVVTKIINSITNIKISTPVAIIISSMILSGGLMGYGAIMQGTNLGANQAVNQAAKQGANKMFVGTAISENDYVLGKRNSNVVIVEYSDPECPFCVKVHPEIKKLQKQYSDKVAFVYRHFPLESIHPRAFDESRAIACAGEVGGEKAFYDYINALYDMKSATQNPSTYAFTPLPENGKEMLAKKIGLNEAKFAACMSSGSTGTIVKNNLQEGADNGVNGTPATFILSKTKNGYEVVASISGAQPAQVFTAAIEEALSR